MVEGGGQKLRFFHCLGNSHRRVNFIGKLEVDGVLHLEEREVKDAAVHFYKDLNFEPELWRPCVERLLMFTIDENGSRWLERPFEKEEILGLYMVWTVIRH